MSPQNRRPRRLLRQTLPVITSQRLKMIPLRGRMRPRDRLNSFASSDCPKPIIDLANSHRQMWNRFLWMGVQNIVLDSYGLPIKASTRTYRRNAKDYKAGHVFEALSILDNYERIRSHRREEGELLAFAPPQIDIEKLGATTVVDDAPKPVVGSPTGLSPGEMLELRARLILS